MVTRYCLPNGVYEENDEHFGFPIHLWPVWPKLELNAHLLKSAWNFIKREEIGQVIENVMIEVCKFTYLK
jgi:hypothetical protein